VGKSPEYGMVLNPNKAQPLTLERGDQVVVLAKTAESTLLDGA
jgi:hypothetical protein